MESTTADNRSENGNTGAVNTSIGSEREPESKNTVQSSQLFRLFEDELKDIYWAEHALSKAIPDMIKHSTSADLQDSLTNHLEETKVQIERLEQVFEMIGQKATAVKCAAMEGLLKEATTIMQDCKKGAMLDAGIIAAAQKVEHYEIASYGTLRQFATTLGLDDAAELLQTTLDEEKAADEQLTTIAVESINTEACEKELVK